MNRQSGTPNGLLRLPQEILDVILGYVFGKTHIPVHTYLHYTWLSFRCYLADLLSAKVRPKSSMHPLPSAIVCTSKPA